MKTIQLLLRSRKVLVALAGLIAAVSAEIGWLPGVPEERITETVIVIGGFAAAVIAAITREDTARIAAGTHPVDPPVPPPLEGPRGDHG